jgi:hypothetical protein
MLASMRNFTALRADAAQLVASFRQDADRYKLLKSSDTGPIERSFAMGHADAMMSAADKLEALLAKYPV